MSTAIGYIRVSTADQAREGVSLENQEERIRAYCTMRGLELAEIVREEGVSATIPLTRRVGGARILEMVKAGAVENVVAIKLDRLFRNAVDALTHTATWDKNGVALHLLDMGGQAIDTSSAIGRMFLTMMSGFGQFERDLIAERTASALRHKKGHRRVYNHTPLGFDRQADELVPNAAEVEVVAKIQAERKAGRSLHKIAAALNDAGVKGKMGGRFYASTIAAILGNDIHQAAA